MAATRLSDIIEPAVFTDYIAMNTAEKTALSQAGVMTRNELITEQLSAGAHSFTVPHWLDLGNDEANLANDNPDQHSVPKKVSAGKQIVRKSFVHQSWSAMNLAAEIAKSDPLAHIQSRVQAYWERQLQRRLISTLQGIQADNLANDDGDMIHNISAETVSAFSPAAVIDATGTLGDSMGTVTAIAMHSDKYRDALKSDLIEFIRGSDGSLLLATYRGLAVVVDDGLAAVNGTYTSILFGAGAIGYGVAAPNKAEGTEIENLPSAGLGGGQQVLHSRLNVAIHPAGFTWNEGTIAGESPAIADLALAAHWTRTAERKNVPLAFLLTK